MYPSYKKEIIKNIYIGFDCIAFDDVAVCFKLIKLEENILNYVFVPLTAYLKQTV